MPNPLLQRLQAIESEPSLGDRLISGVMGQLGTTPEGFLGDVGRLASAPGDYYRGALSGNLGGRTTSAELLERGGLTGPDDPLGGAKTLAYDVATDPLAWAGALRSPRLPSPTAIREGVSPLGRSIAEFAQDESGTLDWSKIAGAFRDPERRALYRSVGPEEYFARQGVPFADVPARQVETLGERMGIPVTWKGPGDVSGAYASYNPGTQMVEIPRRGLWLDPAKMTAEMGSLGGGPNPWLATTNPRHLGVHEMVHALQHREAPSLIDYLRSSGGVMDPERSGWLGRNVSELARMNPHEAVAEIGSKKVITPGAIVKPQVERAWAEYGGPDIRELQRALGLQ